MIEIKTDYKHILVFSHNDNDGLLSAFAIKFAYDNNMINDAWERNVHVILCDYSNEFSLSFFKSKTRQFVTDTQANYPNAKIAVYMLDYVIQPNVDMIKFFNFTKDLGIEFYWCDHHNSSIENIMHYNLPGLQNTKNSGCINTWNFVNKNDEIPNLFKLVNEYDLYNLDSTEFSWKTQIKPFNNYLITLGNDINDNTGHLVKTLQLLLDNDQNNYEFAFSTGISIEKFVNQINKTFTKYIYHGKFLEYSCLAVNSSNKNFEEIFSSHPLFNEVDILVGWVFNGIYYEYNVYSNKSEIDAGDICSKFLNGGGHPKIGGGFSYERLI